MEKLQVLNSALFIAVRMQQIHTSKNEHTRVNSCVKQRRRAIEALEARSPPRQYGDSG